MSLPRNSRHHSFPDLPIPPQWLAVIAWLNRTLGGLGIAIFRLLYVKAQNFVLGCGERTLLWTIAGTNAVLISREDFFHLPCRSVFVTGDRAMF